MIIDLGLADYRKSYEAQRQFVLKRKLGEIADSLIVAEHRKVFTVGRSAKKVNIIAGTHSIEREGIDLITVDRGGDITFHGPGQLVVYPIIDLRNRGRDLHRYLRDTEEAVIAFLRSYSLCGLRARGKTGVWVDGMKISSIGVAASNWITYHGSSVNICCDLGYFSMIRPCGMEGVKMTSLAALLGGHVTTEGAKPRLVSAFCSQFGLEG